MSVKEREEREPLEEAWEEEREPREEEEDMERVEAERSLSWDSRADTLHIVSTNCWCSSCFSSWIFSLSAMHLFDTSMALSKSPFNLRISLSTSSISDLERFLELMERNSLSNCSFSWISSSRSLSDSS